MTAEEKRIRAAGWERDGSPQKKMHEAVTSGSILVFDNGGDMQAAIFGEMSCNLAQSRGCVGVVKDWLVDATGDALDDEAKRLRMTLLQKNEPSSDRLLNVFREIQEGERHAAEMAAYQVQLNQLLEADRAREQQQVKKEQSRRRSKSRVGERKPIRDRVGSNNND